MISHEANPGDFANATGREVRQACRNGRITGPTAGMARGYAQANLVILPQSFAADFAAFCRVNPKPCPLIEMTEPGCLEAVRSAPGSDLRTDLPRYRVLRDGACVDRPTDIKAYWPERLGHPHSTRSEPRTSVRADSQAHETPILGGCVDDALDDKQMNGDGDPLVAFLLGCSFTFEAALLRAGLPVRHIEQGCNVPMYRTNIACEPAGPFHGPLVVSMRPMTREQANSAVAITRAFDDAHGEPVHIGSPTAIGIDELSRPDYGDAVTIRPDEIPVFWACGVTPFEVLQNAKLSLAISHEPGHMFVTDIRSDE